MLKKACMIYSYLKEAEMKYLISFVLGFLTFFLPAFANSSAVELLITSNVLKESRTKIAVIDSGIDLNDKKLKPYICNAGNEDFTGEGLQDTHGHGTNVSWLIVKNLNHKEYCVVSLKYFSKNDPASNLQNELKAFDKAIKMGVTLINFSGGGIGPNNYENITVANALNKNIKVVVAAGNEGSDLSKNCNYFPACGVKHKNFYVVGSIYQNGQRVPHSNYNGAVNRWEVGYMQEGPDGKKMSGTSQATAVFSGKLLSGDAN
jgi:major intracellular serine protease